MRTTQSFRTERLRTYAAIFALCTGLVLARPTPADAAAEGFKAHYEGGLKLYKAKKWKEALAEFEAAYAIKSDPAALYSIARCHHNLADPEKAIEGYQRYLHNWPKHKGVGKATGYLVDALVAVGRGRLALLDHAAAEKAFARAKKIYGASHPKLDDTTGGMILAGLGEAVSYVGTPDAAIPLLEQALAAALPDADRARTVALLEELRTEPEPAVLPDEGGETDPEEPGPHVAEPIEVEPIDPGDIGTKPPGPGAAATKPPEPIEPTKKKRPGIGVWLGIGGGVLVAAGAAAAVIALVLTRRPNTVLGYIDFDLDP